MEDSELADYVSQIQALHPSLTIRLERASTAALCQRILDEGDEGGWDIVLGCALTSFLDPRIQRLLAPLDAIDLRRLPTCARDDAGRWFSPSGFVPAFCVNRGRLNKLGLPDPQSWEDLAHPGFRGELIIPDPAFSGAGFLHLMALLDANAEDHVYEVLGRVASNKPAIVRSALAPCEVVAAGKAAVGVTVSTAVRGLMNREFAVDIVLPTDAQAIEPEAFGLRRGSRSAAWSQRVLAWTLTPIAAESYRRYGKVAFVPARTRDGGRPTFRSINPRFATNHRNKECARWAGLFLHDAAND